MISVPVAGYVQSQNRTVHSAIHMMIPWFQDTKWEPVPCCLADHPDFLLYMSLVDNSVTMGPWFKLSVFGELGLNN